MKRGHATNREGTVDECEQDQSAMTGAEMSSDRTEARDIDTPSYRANAIAVGVLFIACSAAAILSLVPLGTPVSAPVDFATLAANDSRVVLTALIEFVWAATAAGIAIGLYPVL